MLRALFVSLLASVVLLTVIVDAHHTSFPQIKNDPTQNYTFVRQFYNISGVAKDLTCNAYIVDNSGSLINSSAVTENSQGTGFYYATFNISHLTPETIYQMVVNCTDANNDFASQGFEFEVVSNSTYENLLNSVQSVNTSINSHNTSMFSRVNSINSTIFNRVSAVASDVWTSASRSLTSINWNIYDVWSRLQNYVWNASQARGLDANLTSVNNSLSAVNNTLFNEVNDVEENQATLLLEVDDTEEWIVSTNNTVKNVNATLFNEVDSENSAVNTSIFDFLPNSMWTYTPRTLTSMDAIGLNSTAIDDIDSRLNTSHGEGSFLSADVSGLGVNISSVNDTVKAVNQSIFDFIPDSVWSYSTRSLSTFGSLVSDIWSSAIRTLTQVGNVGLNSTALNDVDARINSSHGTGSYSSSSSVDNSAVANAVWAFNITESNLTSNNTLGQIWETLISTGGM